jgi:diguanylate cyclase (GGDEF)-like protein
MLDSTSPTRRQPRDSLATKIIFFVFFSTFVTALVVSWISVQSTYAFLRSHLDSAYPLLLDRTRSRIDGALGDAQQALERLAREPALQHLKGDGAASTSVREALERFIDAEPRFAGVLVQPAGSPLAAASGGTVPSRLARELATPSEAHVEGGAGRITASAPIRGPNGATIGVLHAVLDLDSLRGQLIAARSPDEAQAHLVDHDGRILASSQPPELAGFESFPPELLARAKPTPAFEFRSDHGRRGIGVYAPLAAAGLGVVVAQPLDVAFAPVFSVVTRVFVIDLAIILAFSFLAYEITAKIVRPLEALSEGARRISQGELEVGVADTGTHDELGLLTRTFNDMAQQLRRNREEIDEQHGQLREQNEALQRANEVLEQLSITDGLTKLHNHRYFQEALAREIKRVARSGEPLSILLADIDDFKALNDRYGHAQGDALLVRIARVLNESVRESDVLARYGGEEFVVLATGTDLEGAIFLAEKVRTAVAESEVTSGDEASPPPVTISIGVAEFGGDRKRFFDAADRALYRAKAAGKNCVMAATPSDAD